MARFAVKLLGACRVNPDKPYRHYSASAVRGCPGDAGAVRPLLLRGTVAGRTVYATKPGSV